jgi:hypothetical protein
MNIIRRISIIIFCIYFRPSRGKKSFTGEHKTQIIICGFAALFLLFIFLFVPSVLCFGGRPAATEPYRMEIRTYKNEYTIGEKIKMSIKFTNTSSEVMSSYYPSSQKFDFIVTDINSREVWRWSRGKMFLMEVIPFRLKAGETLKYDWVWDQKDSAGKQVPFGSYRITGMINISPAVISQTKNVDIYNVGEE